MRRLLTCVIMTIAVAHPGLMAKDGYGVFKTSGVVLVKTQKEGKWKVAEKRMAVQPTDSVCLETSSMISVIDNRTSRISRMDEAGLFTVKEIMERSGSVAKTVARTLVKGVTDVQSRKNTFSMMGASTMKGMAVYGEENHIQMEESLYAALYKVLKNIEDGETGGRNPAFLLSKKYISDSEFVFKIHNRTDAAYYFNIVRLADDVPGLCFVPSEDYTGENLFVPAESRLELPHYVFGETDDKAKYVLFVTEDPFEHRKLQEFLQNNKKPSKKMTPYPKMYIGCMVE